MICNGFGVSRFEYCWPAISNDSDGVVFVYNPNDGSQAKDINMWYTHFVEQTGLREDVCLVIANRFSSDEVPTTKGEGKLCKFLREYSGY